MTELYEAADLVALEKEQARTTARISFDALLQ